MEVGSQTEPMDRQDILNLLRQKSFELEKKTGVSCGDQDEIHSVEIIDGESPHFNSHNEDTTGAGLRKNSQAVGKQLSSKKSLKAGHPLEQPSLADMICDAVWSRKGSFHSPGPSRSSSKKSRLVRSQSFSKGSSSTSSSLSPTKAHPTDGSTNGTGGIPTTTGVCMDPYARRPSGAASYILRSAGNRPYSSASREHLPTSSPKFDSRVRRSQGDIDINRQISATLSIPSRENSVKSCSSKSTSGQISPVVITPPSNTPYGYGYWPTNPTVMIPAQPSTFSEMTPHFYRGQVSPGSSNCLTPITHGRGSRSSSIAQSTTGSGHQHQFREEFEDHVKQKRQRKYVVVGFTFLLIVAVACVVISLGLSSRVTPPGSVDTVQLVTVVQNYTDDQEEGEVRKENENLMRVIQHTSPNLNLTNTSNFSTPVPPPPLLIDDQDESSGNYNNNNNNNFGGSSLTRSVITVDPGPGPLPKVDSSLERDMGIRSMRNESESPTTNSSSFTFTTTNPAPIPLAPLDFDRDRDESGTLSSSLIADILLSSSSGDRKTKTRVDKPKNKFPVDNVMMQDAAVPLGNSETSINAETPYTEQIISDSDIDENEYDRVRTSIVLR